ncbi:armadillo-type protein [Hyaloraphidium curvatum]|nr:armadillo-type protein [Hyaloraphidium curvatum]
MSKKRKYTKDDYDEEVARIVTAIEQARPDDANSWKLLDALGKDPRTVAKEPKILGQLNEWVRANFAACPDAALKSLCVDALVAAAGLLEPVDALEILGNVFSNLQDEGDRVCFVRASTGALGVLRELKAASWPAEAFAPLSALVEETLLNLGYVDGIVRASSLETLAEALGIASAHGRARLAMLSESDLAQLAANFTADPDWRVRSVAVQVLVKIGPASLAPDAQTYSRLCALLKDTSATVRRHAIDLVWSMASERTLAIITVENEGQRLRLLDDAFSRLCDLVNDGEVPVRVHVAATLGKFRGVETLLLKQTLSKQILKPKKRSGGQGPKRKKRKTVDTSFSIGDVDAEEGEVALMEASSCGAFIHALEDEFEEVRNTAIDSLRDLCVSNLEFARYAIDFLLDMLNDEMDHVRLNAVDTLCVVANAHSAMALDEEQLKTVMTLTLDHDVLCRRSAYRFLESIRIAGPASMLHFVDILYVTLRRYPGDTEPVYKCMSLVGKHHPDIVREVMSKLFRIDSRFLAQEIALQDVQHVGNVFLLFGACSAQPRMLETVPAYLRQHYGFISLRYPALAPRLEREAKGLAPMEDLESTPDELERDFGEIVDVLLSKLSAVEKLSPATPLRVVDNALRSISADLDALHGGDRGRNTKCELIASHLLLCRTLLKVKDATNDLSFPGALEHLSCWLLSESYRIEQTFRLLPQEYLLHLRAVRAVAHATWLLSAIRLRHPPQEKVTKLLRRFSHRLVRLRRLCGSQSIPFFDALATALSSGVDNLEQFLSRLQESLPRIWLPRLHGIPADLVRPSVELSVPGGNGSEEALEVVGGMPSTIELVARTHFVEVGSRPRH